MNTIAEILLDCEEKDRLSDGNGNFWTVSDKYEEKIKDTEKTQVVVISLPDKDNKKDYELWSVGLESDVSMEGLSKI